MIIASIGYVFVVSRCGQWLARKSIFQSLKMLRGLFKGTLCEICFLFWKKKSSSHTKNKYRKANLKSVVGMHQIML